MRTAMLIVLLLCSTALAQPKANIQGPGEALAGDLVVLSARESVGDGFRWVQPEGVQTLQCGDGMDLAFASGRPGVYTFMLIAADKEAAIDYARHSVVIRAQGTEPAPPVEREPEKPTPPAPPLQELVELSRNSSKALGDQPTATALAATIRATAGSIQSRCDAGTCPGLAEAKRLMVQSIEMTLLARSGNSRNVDWANGWRVPVNAKLQSINTTTVPAYLTAMRAVATGLAE